jgi:hypothetical protein
MYALCVQCLAWLKTACPIRKSGDDDRVLFGIIGCSGPKRDCRKTASSWQGVGFTVMTVIFANLFY